MPSDSRARVLHLIDRAALVFLAASLTVRPLTSGQIEGVEVAALLQLFPLFAALFWLFRMVLLREVRIAPTGLGVPLLLFAASMVVSVLRASCKFPAMAAAFESLVDLLLFGLVVQVVRDDPDRRRTLERVFLATALVVTLYALHQRVRGFPEMTAWVEQNAGEAQRMLGLDAINWEDFKSRLGTYEVFSTFMMPNVLAGYFLMVLPLVVVALWTGHAQSGRGRLARAVHAAFLAAVLVALAWTGAKGAWACVPFQAILFVLLLGGQIPRRTRVAAVVALSLGLAAAAALLLAVPRFQGYAAGLADSLQVRFGYWITAWRMLSAGWANFCFGVGLSNFQEAYPVYKTLDASEVQKAHNHYLQLWTEVGAWGLLAFLSAWSIWTLRCLRMPLGSDAGPSGRHRWSDWATPLLGGALGFLTVIAFAQPFKNLPSSTDYGWITAVLFAVWCGYVLLDAAQEQPVTGPREAVFLRAGYLAAAAGILLHSLIDFDLSLGGNSQGLWLLAALAVTLQAEAEPWKARVSPAAQIGLTAAALALFLALTSFLFPRVASSEAHKREARVWLSQALLPGGMPQAEPLERAVQALQNAVQENPQDPESFFELATALQYRWLLNPEGRTAEEAYEAYRRGIELAPLRGVYHLHLGQFLDLLAQRPPAFLRTRVLQEYAVGEERPGRPAEFEPALTEYARAAQLYATRPASHLPLADLLWRLDRKDEARARYQEILDLDARIHPRWKNLKLAPADRKRAAARAEGSVERGP
ncbi:MAG: O-antigen ligase family protein [Planctomycetes bacterium]|nr:O-antigen ligase family protein [Planctomycetota bacterium]